MKLIQILPELDMGGVERHVIDLSNGLSEKGHDVLVISNGGRMRSQLSKDVLHRRLPAHKKNPVIAWKCSQKISEWIRNEGWELIHAHSRVPAWIAWCTSSKTNIPWIQTAHACYSLNYGLMPLKYSRFVISVSETVERHIKDFLPKDHSVVPAALPEPTIRWDPQSRYKNKFIFVGRLTKIKGLSTVIQAFGGMEEKNWTLDVIGDGVERKELEEMAKELGIESNINFCGYSDDIDNLMSRSSCLLFPSFIEGYGLVLARAVQVGIPTIASNIPSVSEIAGSSKGLLPPGDVNEWRRAIINFISSGKTEVMIPASNIPTLKKMVDSNEAICKELIND